MQLVDIVRVAHSIYPQLMAEPHVHSEVEVNFVLAGRMTYRFGSGFGTLAAGDLGLFWGTVPHRVTKLDGPTSYVCLYLPIDSFLGLPASAPFKSAIIHGHLLKAAMVETADTSQFLRWSRDIETRDPRRMELVRDELAGRLRRMDLDGWSDLSAVSDPTLAACAHGMEKAQQIARFIALNLDQPIGVSEIAAAVALHPNYAMALFKRSLGLTIGQYLNQLRLSHAEAQLFSTDRDVTRIAFESGFGSLSRFYEAFHTHFGHAPVEHRRRFRSMEMQRSDA